MSISHCKTVVQCERWVTMAILVNHRQPYIAQIKSRGYCLKVTNFHWDSLSGLRTAKESYVGERGSDLISVLACAPRSN